MSISYLHTKRRLALDGIFTVPSYIQGVDIELGGDIVSIVHEILGNTIRPNRSHDIIVDEFYELLHKSSLTWRLYNDMKNKIIENTNPL